MKLQDLQRAVNNIQIDPAMQEEILQQVKERTKESGKYTAKEKTNPGDTGATRIRQRKPVSALRIAAMAAGVFLAVGVISIPVKAFVSSLVKERMEEVPKEELQEMVEMMDSQEVGADSYIREYTAEERSRMSELYSQYQQGVFPKGELPQTESEEEAEALGLCYLTTTSTFYLPDRELTDEELLQLIDFEVKRNYALKERYEEEYADEIAAKEQKQKEQIAEVVDAGGITEEEAIIEAQKWLEKMYGITGEGLEMNHYFWEGEASYSEETDMYMVNWTDFPNREYFYFYISARDGGLVEADHSGGNMVGEERKEFTPDELEKELPLLKEKAISFLKDIFGKNVESYVESYLNYAIITVPDGQRTGSIVDFVFAKEDGTADIVRYMCDGTFSLYSRTFDISAYWERKAENDESHQKFEKERGNEMEIERIIKSLNEI